MSAPDPGRRPVPILAELPEDALESMLPRIRQAIRDVVESLELPVPVALETRPGDGRLIIGRHAIRLNVDAGHESGLHGIWRLAGELVDEETTKTIWRDWFGAGSASPPQVSLADLGLMLGQIVRLGYKVSRLRHVFTSGPPMGLSPVDRRALFESAIAASNCGIVRIAVDRWSLSSARDGRGQSSLVDDFIRDLTDRLFAEQGILPSSVALQQLAELARGELRVEWNDLRLTEPLRTSIAATGAGEIHLDHHVRRVAEVLAGSEGALVTRPLIELYLLRLREAHPTLVDTFEKRTSSDLATALFRDLAADGISLAHSLSILTAMVTFAEVVSADSASHIIFHPLGVFAGDAAVLARQGDLAVPLAFVRGELKRALSHQYASNGSMSCYLVDHDWEKRLVREGGLSAAERRALIEAVRETIVPGTTVILTTMEVRCPLREEIRTEFPDLRVISYNELSPDLNIRPIARIDLKDLDD